MVHIVFWLRDGTRLELDVPPTGSLMQAARDNNVPGIDADCGGCMACGTCHVVVDPAWYDLLTPPSDSEREILEYVRDPEPNLRLTCQIPVTEALSGITMRIPEHQH